MRDRPNKLKKEIRSLKKKVGGLEKIIDGLKNDRERLFNIVKIERVNSLKYVDEYQMSMVAMGFDMSNVQLEFFDRIRRKN